MINRWLISVVKIINKAIIGFYILAVIVAIVLIYCDVRIFNSYFISLIARNIIYSERGELYFTIGYYINKNVALSGVMLGFVVILAGHIRKSIKKRIIKTGVPFFHILYLPFSITGFGIMLSISLLFLFHVLLGRYVQLNFVNATQSVAFSEQYHEFRNELLDNKETAKLAFHQIIYQVEKEPEFLEAMSLTDIVSFCDGVNQLVDNMGGPKTAIEHYFRNALNYAPNTIDEMLSEIENPIGVEWILLPPKESVLHMFGEGGEYNLKFVSSDGMFEAVYNINGELLSMENDPLNMGTYNYANPITDKEKHALYDVAAYFEYGNVSPDEMQIIENTSVYPLDAYYENEEAKLRYLKIKLQVESLRNRGE